MKMMETVPTMAVHALLLLLLATRLPWPSPSLMASKCCELLIASHFSAHFVTAARLSVPVKLQSASQVGNENISNMRRYIASTTDCTAWTEARRNARTLLHRRTHIGGNLLRHNEG